MGMEVLFGDLFGLCSHLSGKMGRYLSTITERALDSILRAMVLTYQALSSSGCIVPAPGSNDHVICLSLENSPRTKVPAL